MKRLWLLSVVSLLACDAEREPRAQPWSLEEGAGSASHVVTDNMLKTFPFQTSSRPVMASATRGEVGYVFEIVDGFHQTGKPPELSYLSARRDDDAGMQTVWLRLPKEVLGFEAAFECPATSGMFYSTVAVAPGIEVSCTVGRLRSSLTVVFSGVDESWDRTNPRIAIGLAPDEMLYEWRLKGWQDGDFPEIFHFAYLSNSTWVEDATYGGYRL
jgi:hypothetical protein